MDFQSLLTRLRALGGSLSTSQIVSLVVSFVLVVGIVGGSALWLNAPRYTLLFADMDSEAAAQVVARLKTMKVPYKLDEGGRSIRVASDRVDELRLDLTAQGLPSSGRIGFEIFDRTTFGATEFVEQVNFRRALEGEIARTIGTLSEVSSARVHIAMGKDTLFGEKRPATASVVLKLRDQRGLPPTTAAGIANLVAASVEGLRPESVVVLDSAGRPLTKQVDDGAIGGAAQAERQQRLEHDMGDRVIALLEPVVGEGRVRVNVAMKLNPASREQTEERFDPNGAVVRSRQTSADVTNGGATGAAAGVAGTRSNLPPDAAPTGAAAAAATAAATAAAQRPALPGASRQNEVTNYEISKIVTHTIEPPGDVARMSVAVIVDDAVDAANGGAAKRVPRKPEELQKLQSLVAAAVGIDEQRGDQLTVQNVAFGDALTVEAPAPSFLVRYQQPIQDGVRTVGILALGIVGLLMLRPMLQRAMTPGAALPQPRALAAMTAGGVSAKPLADRPRTVSELQSRMEAPGLGGTAHAEHARFDESKLPALTKQLAGFAQAEPATTAKLLRSWLEEPEE